MTGSNLVQMFWGIGTKEFKARLQGCHVEVTPTSVKVVEGWDAPQGLLQLNKKVQNGYWVYLYFMGPSYHEFSWFEDEQQARTFYEGFSVAERKGILKYTNWEAKML